MNCDRKETQFKTPTCLGLSSGSKDYNPHEKKLDLRTTSGYFIDDLEKSKGYIFYYPSFSMRIVEFENDRFIENGKLSGITEPQNVKIQEARMQGLLSVTSSKVVVLVFVEGSKNFQEQQINDPISHNEVVDNESVVAKP